MSATTQLSRPFSASSSSSSSGGSKKGKILVLGGNGFLGQEVCKCAVLEGYQVTSLSRRGVPPDDAVSTTKTSSAIEYRKGDARHKETITNILLEEKSDSSENYVGVIHCIGLLFDTASGWGSYNRFVSGSKSLPDAEATYDTITRLTTFNAIDATMEYCNQLQQQQANDNPQETVSVPFVFTSAAEAGWPDMGGGPFIEKYLAPEWLQRYLTAKRAVESRLLALDSNTADETTVGIRPVIARPSLIYSMDRKGSLPSVAAFFVGYKIGLPFVDRPVSVQNLAAAMVRAIGDPSVKGLLRYPEIDRLSAATTRKANER